MTPWLYKPRLNLRRRFKHIILYFLIYSVGLFFMLFIIPSWFNQTVHQELSFIRTLPTMIEYHGVSCDLLHFYLGILTIHIIIRTNINWRKRWLTRSWLITCWTATFTTFEASNPLIILLKRIMLTIWLLIHIPTLFQLISLIILTDITLT